LAVEVYLIALFFTNNNTILTYLGAHTGIIVCAVPAGFNRTSRRATVVVPLVAVVTGFSTLQVPVAACSGAAGAIISTAIGADKCTTPAPQALTGVAVEVGTITFFTVSRVDVPITASPAAISGIELAQRCAHERSHLVVVPQGGTGILADVAVALLPRIDEPVATGIDGLGLRIACDQERK